MEASLVIHVDQEIERGLAKWGHVDQVPDNLISAAVEELGEAAHAINHNEGVVRIQQEIAEVIGVLARLYEMVEVQKSDETEKPQPTKCLRGRSR